MKCLTVRLFLRYMLDTQLINEIGNSFETIVGSYSWTFSPFCDHTVEEDI